MSNRKTVINIEFGGFEVRVIGKVVTWRDEDGSSTPCFDSPSIWMQFENTKHVMEYVNVTEFLRVLPSVSPLELQMNYYEVIKARAEVEL